MGGSCQKIEDIPKEIRDIFVVSSDLSVTEHVRMQAVMQKWIDNSISKTINFPPARLLRMWLKHIN
jgi:ribonucleoside-diphosphate reductase alpha chain